MDQSPEHVVDPSDGQSVEHLDGHFVDQSPGHVVDHSPGHFVDQSSGCFADQSPGHFEDQSARHVVDQSGAVFIAPTCRINPKNRGSLAAGKPAVHSLPGEILQESPSCWYKMLRTHLSTIKKGE